MNCKPGDLAIVIKANKKHVDAIGRIVVVVRLWDGLADTWVVEFVGTMPRSLTRFYETGCKDSALRPVSGIPDTQDTDINIKEPA